MRVVLVLNADYSPMNITSLKKGFKLVFKGKAEVVSEDNAFSIVTDKRTFYRPSIIRLVKYVSYPYKKIPLSKQNIFKRDNFTCAYCPSTKDLTLDHIIPKSKGGGNTWLNLTTCCFKCNAKKGDKSLEEVGMVLLRKPFQPSHFYFLSKLAVKEEWKVYFK